MRLRDLRRPAAAPVDLLALRLGAVQGAANHVEERPLADDLPQRPADRRLAGELEQLRGAVVGEEDALVGVQGDDALDHAAEDGAQLLAVLLQLGDARRQPFAHAIEGAAEHFQIIVGREEDAGVAADVLDGPGQLSDGPRQLPAPPQAHEQQRPPQAREARTTTHCDLPPKRLVLDEAANGKGQHQRRAARGMPKQARRRRNMR